MRCGVPYHTQKGGVAKSPQTLRHQVTGKDCAIVGNGGSALREPFYGEAIDKHDVVLRFNQV